MRQVQMDRPSWQDSQLGTMKRVGLWLADVVGEGNVFTKEQLREAFPGVSQVDRRMRDLRARGWRIDTNREDFTLGAHEQRFVMQGTPVWEPGKAGLPSTTINATLRRELMQKDSHLCRSCGIGPGQSYQGSYETAQLDVARRDVVQPDGSVKTMLVTECNKCRVGGRGLSVDLKKLLSRLQRLSQFEREIMAGWMAAGSREFSELERLWGEYQALPAEARDEVRKSLATAELA
ncbi:hypothetical protein ACQEU3_19850 [Spirillospora sp. CA-253888]